MTPEYTNAIELERQRQDKRKQIEDALFWLVFAVPYDLDKNKMKEPIQKPLRVEIIARDRGTCQMCGKVGEYGCKSPYITLTGRHQIHHIIPNGEATMDNLTTLCLHCHTIIHKLLFIMGKWKHTLPR